MKRTVGCQREYIVWSEDAYGNRHVCRWCFFCNGKIKSAFRFFNVHAHQSAYLGSDVLLYNVGFSMRRDIDPLIPLIHAEIRYHHEASSSYLLCEENGPGPGS